MTESDIYLTKTGVFSDSSGLFYSLMINTAESRMKLKNIFPFGKKKPEKQKNFCTVHCAAKSCVKTGCVCVLGYLAKTTPESN